MNLKLFFSALILGGQAVAVHGGPTYGKVNPVKGLDLTQSYTRTCTVSAKGNGEDDSDAIEKAFRKCKKDSLIVFKNTTYNVGRVFKFTNLNNVKIDIKGTLKWSNDTDYWLQNSIPIGPGDDQNSYPPAAYQNQTTAFMLGGKHLYVEGHGYGTFDGNGQVWYDLVKGESNYPRRPHAIVITAKDSYFHGLRWVQPQMWTVTIVGSKRVLLEDIFVQAKSSNRNPARNTDGANTMFSDYITFRGWEVENGDDCIALKANSTNILLENLTFIKGQGVAIGSIGQYDGHYETVNRVTARNIKMYKSKYVARIKTWTGEVNEYPPNGGGGGIGRAEKIIFENIEFQELENTPFIINQCYSNVGTVDCNTSLFEVGDATYSNITGTTESSRRAQFQCSKAQNGCEGLVFEDINVKKMDGSELTSIRCSNVIEPEGFTCG
ncbi:polygalacturonase [Dactylonectria macrodidyma]|uniref:Polygalacturonase n=1 Tax=Dactylonectria macrodidyma TaxID=307937 RepID=A0A9P9E1J7_9HYPO|nr:polygalacturonase [Dactylonectria macrodidyma]